MYGVDEQVEDPSAHAWVIDGNRGSMWSWGSRADIIVATFDPFPSWAI